MVRAAKDLASKHAVILRAANDLASKHGCHPERSEGSRFSEKQVICDPGQQIDLRATTLALAFCEKLRLRTDDATRRYHHAATTPNATLKHFLESRRS